MNTMNNNAFNYYSPNGYFNQAQQFGVPMPGMTPNNNFIQAPMSNGVLYNPVQTASHTICTDEEMQKIRQMGGSVTFDYNEEEQLRAKWDFRDGNILSLELIDPSTQRVRAKYTGEEFNLVEASDEEVKTIIEMVKNLVNTTKAYDPKLGKIGEQLYIATGMICKLLPAAYARARNNYKTILNQSQNQTQNVGYFGNNGMNNSMFGGMYGQMPNYIVSDGSTPPPMNNIYNPNPMMQNYGYNNPNPMMQGYGYNPNPNPMMQGYGYNPNPNPMQGMGTPMPTGGTIMPNPFVQNGVPQQVPPTTQTPQIQTPKVPTPGTPINNPNNPGIGTVVNQNQNQQNNNPTATVTVAPF